MSTKGTATVTAVQLPSRSTDMSTTGAGTIAVVGAPIILAGAAIIGTGILIGKGIVWCGEKLEENYQGACKQWTNLTENARLENMQNVREMGEYLADQLDCLTASSYLTTNTSTLQTDALDTQTLNLAFARTQQTFVDAPTVAHNRAQTQHQQLVNRLQAEISAGRGILAPQDLQRAEIALQGSVQELQQALKQLQGAWGTITEAASLRTRNIRQTQQILRSVRTQLTAINTLLSDIKSSARQMLFTQQETIEGQVREAESFVDVHPASAVEKARQAEQSVRRLMETVSEEIVVSWSSRRKDVNTLRGMVNSLDTMLKEASTIQLIEATQIDTLSQRIQKIQASLSAVEQNNTPNASQQLTHLKTRIELLKQDVFAVVRTTQQRNVAQTISTTLAEFGFQAGDGRQSALQVQGDVLHIQTMLNRGSTPEKRDDKSITFDIALDGAVSYDFSGYVGDSCLHDAQQIFTALRQKGLFILDKQGSIKLQHMANEAITQETLQDEQFLPAIVRNKTQAELAESLMRILQGMGYPNIQQRAIGGSIELEAFQGKLGYRVVLEPDGEAHILKDEQRIDVAGEFSDPLVAEVQRCMQQTQDSEDEQEQSQTTVVQKQKRQLLG